jgi:TPR repeat protein
MYNLGIMYSAGQGVPQDAVEGHMWRSLAAARAPANSQKDYVATRDAFASQLTPEQLAEAQKRTREWLEAFEKTRLR